MRRREEDGGYYIKVDRGSTLLRCHCKECSEKVLRGCSSFFGIFMQGLIKIELAYPLEGELCDHNIYSTVAAAVDDVPRSQQNMHSLSSWRPFSKSSAKSSHLCPHLDSLPSETWGKRES